MKNYDPYKRIILFFTTCINVALTTSVFSFVWFNYYNNQLIHGMQFYFRGHIIILSLYFILAYFFSNTFGGSKIGKYRRIEVLLSEYLGIFLVDCIIYSIICMLAFAIVSPVPLLASYFIQVVVSTLWTFIITPIYNRIFQPWKMLLVYGDHSAVDLVYKVETRRDKYAIYDAISINEGMDAVAKKMKDFQAIIIGDISAVERNDLLKYCYANGVRTYVIPKISDLILMGADKINIFDTPILLTKGYTLTADQRFWKRTFDIIFALILIVLTSPIMLITALAIKLCDHGPVLYKQTRCTRYQKDFSIYKFRSMIVDAEKDGGARLASENDDRITPVGKIIRATRIDELPQLFNILRGQMSFVGPRPERPEIMEEYREMIPEFDFRLRVKAGLTGYAQVFGRYNTTPYDKLKLDLYYIENYSLWTDMKLILMTLKTMLKRDATAGVADNQTTAAKSEDTEISVEEVVKEIVEQNE